MYTDDVNVYIDTTLKSDKMIIHRFIQSMYGGTTNYTHKRPTDSPEESPGIPWESKQFRFCLEQFRFLFRTILFLFGTISNFENGKKPRNFPKQIRWTQSKHKSSSN